MGFKSSNKRRTFICFLSELLKEFPTLSKNVVRLKTRNPHRGPIIIEEQSEEQNDKSEHLISPVMNMSNMMRFFSIIKNYIHVTNKPFYVKDSRPITIITVPTMIITICKIFV